MSHLRPLLGGVDSSSPTNSSTSNGEAESSRQSVSGKNKCLETFGRVVSTLSSAGSSGDSDRFTLKRSLLMSPFVFGNVLFPGSSELYFKPY